MKDSITGRLISALLLAAVLALLFWLRPDLEPGMLGANTPEMAFRLVVPIVIVFIGYIFVQGYPISHGNIGSSNTHNLDNIVSGIPAIVALFGIFAHYANFWPLSEMNLLLALLAIVVITFDLWVLGGAASRINRLTDEFKSEK